MSQLQLNLLSLTFTFALGCKACDTDDDSYVPSAEAQPERSAADEVQARMEAHPLDRSNVYPKDAEGRVACGPDADCFVIQAEHCTMATFTTDHKFNPYGIEQRVQARHLILGSDAGKCRFAREVLSLDVTLHPTLIEALKKKSDGDDLIASMKTDSLAAMRRDNPAREECWFDAGQALAAAIDIADGRDRQKRHPVECHAIAIADDGTAAVVPKPVAPTPTQAPGDPKPTTP